MLDSENRADLAIDKLRTYKNHPFNNLDEESINEMAESIKTIGVINSISVRPIDGEEEVYEILSGHKRVEAAKKAGLPTIPAKIFRNLTDDIAAIIMCETNFFQVSFPTFKHSEKAKSIAEYYNALKSQGKRNDLLEIMNGVFNEDGTVADNGDDETFAQVTHKLKTRDKAAKKFGLDRGTIERYLRVSQLSDDLLRRLDNKEFKIAPAVEISYLGTDEQGCLNSVLCNEDYRLDTKIAEELRAASKTGSLSEEDIEVIFDNSPSSSKMKLSPNKIFKSIKAKYFLDYESLEEIEKEISEALEAYRSKKKTKKNNS